MTNIPALVELLEKATPGPWAYRPQEHDDWGMIRTTVRQGDWFPVVARARDVGQPSEADISHHRREGADPTAGNAELIVAAVNALPALLAERASIREGLKDAVAMLIELQPGYVWGSEPYNRIEYEQKLLVARLEALLADGETR